MSVTVHVMKNPHKQNPADSPAEMQVSANGSTPKAEAEDLHISSVKILKTTKTCKNILDHNVEGPDGVCLRPAHFSVGQDKFFKTPTCWRCMTFEDRLAVICTFYDGD